MKIKIFIIVILLLLIGGGIFFGIRYYYVFGEGVKSGELNYVVKKGYVFKTYEGKMIQSGFKSSPKAGAIQSNEFIFSIEDKETAEKLMTMGGRQIDVHYKEYFHSLPWRGNSEFVVDSFVIKVENISLDKIKLDLVIGDKEKLVASVYPEDASNQTVNWTSSNDNIVSVTSDGSIVAKADGKATIYASVENKTVSCEVFVSDKKKETESLDWHPRSRSNEPQEYYEEY